MVAFVFVILADYAGALRALNVYFYPDQNGVFLSDDSDPRATGRCD